MLSDELIDFVVSESGISEIELTPNTCIIHDLGITGADGVEFIIAYSKKFGVELSGFSAEKYFGNEGLQIFNTLFVKLGLRRDNLGHLFMKDLQNGISSGYLV
jgi:acyl carrier protein